MAKFFLVVITDIRHNNICHSDDGSYLQNHSLKTPCLIEGYFADAGLKWIPTLNRMWNILMMSQVGSE